MTQNCQNLTQLHQCYSVRVHLYAYIPYWKVLKHFIHVQYGCEKQSMVVYSLNHDIMASFPLISHHGVPAFLLRKNKMRMPKMNSLMSKQDVEFINYYERLQQCIVSWTCWWRLGLVSPDHERLGCEWASQACCQSSGIYPQAATRSAKQLHDCPFPQINQGTNVVCTLLQDNRLQRSSESGLHGSSGSETRKG